MQTQIKLSLAGDVFAALNLREAVLSAVSWRRLIAEILPEADAPVIVERWPGRVVANDARNVRADPDHARQLFASLGDRRFVFLFTGQAERLQRETAEALQVAGAPIALSEIGTQPLASAVEEILRNGGSAVWVDTADHQVHLEVPEMPLFVGSYARVRIDIEEGSGLSFDDLAFAVPAGEVAGLVSLARDERFDRDRPEIMFLAGYGPGLYLLQAIKTSSGDVVGEAVFALTTQWDTVEEGPPLWVTGDFELPGIAGSAWGGGSPTEPENFNVHSALGTRQVAVLLVDTKSQRFTVAEELLMRTEWEEISFNGRMIGGQLHSVSHFYREVSYNKFDFTGEVFGPVHLLDEWESYFDSRGVYKPHLWQACATASDHLIDFSKFHHLVCVVRQVDATGSEARRAVWPHADSFVAKTAEGDRALATAVMNSHNTDLERVAALAHELGHNLHLGDIYPWGGHPPQIQARALEGWALMANHSGLPHPVLVNRMRLGWIDKSHLKLYNFQATGGRVDEEVTLEAVERGTPPTGRYVGIEVRIAPDFNYYFEYRAAQAGQIGDQRLPVDRRVLGTEANFAEGFEALARQKPVMLLRQDSDGDGPVLGAGQDYREQDVSEPSFPTDFRIKVLETDAEMARVRVQYGVHSQPDPSIRPWQPPVYRSPDIEVRNERSRADPKWQNTPWTNHHNTVVAMVTNRGALNAPSVWVDFFVKDYTVNMDGVQPRLIGSESQDVPAQQAREFTTIWMPGAEGHYCIEARIRHYQTPGPNSVMEATEYNNRAQTNYARFISATSSPPSREIAQVKVHNPFNEQTRIAVRTARSTSPLFRTFIGHQWMRLQPGETRKVTVMFEYAKEEKGIINPEIEAYIGRPNDVTIVAFADMPQSAPEAAAVPLGGINAQVITGHATRFERFTFDPPRWIGGAVVTKDTGDSPSEGQVIVIFVKEGRETYRTVPLDRGGRFQAEPPDDWDTAQAYYIPADGYGDSESAVVHRR